MITERVVCINADVVKSIPEVDSIRTWVPVAAVEEFNVGGSISNLSNHRSPLILSDFSRVKLSANIEED